MSLPWSLRVAAGLVAVEALAIGVYGVVELVRSVTGHPLDRGTAVFLGVIVVGAAAAVAATAVGLWRARRWSQTPTYLTQSFGVVIALLQLHTVPALAVPVLVVAAATLVAVTLPASRSALGGV
jgi:hypothetical protein